VPFDNGAWYLPALAFWRLAISPLLALARSPSWHLVRHQEVIVAIMLLLPSFVCLHRNPFEDLFDTGAHIPRYNAFADGKVFAYAPYFLAGATVPLQTWTTFLRSGSWLVISVCLLVAWYLPLLVSSEARNWNCMACLEAGYCSADGPALLLEQPLTVRGFFLAAFVYAVTLAISLSVAAVVFSATVLLRELQPWLVSCIASWGSRTLYAYILQTLLVDVWSGAKVLQTHAVLTYIFDHVPPGFRLVTVWACCVPFTIMLSCRASERLFSSIIMPLWLLDLPWPWVGAAEVEEQHHELAPLDVAPENDLMAPLTPISAPSAPTPPVF